MKKMELFRTEFNQYLANQSFETGPQRLYEPIRYIMSIGGKRVRPMLALLAADLFKGEIAQVLPVAYSVELFHNFSLVHDDIMDEAPLRRGKEAVHKKFGRDAGILSGDVMLVYVYQYIMNSQFPMAIKHQQIATFNAAAIEVCEGQQLDMDFEQMEEVPMDLYLDMIDKKTAALLWASLKMGALPFAKPEEAEMLGQFGRFLGLAFQLRDDYLDTFGRTEETGKQEGGDILQHKKTILYIYALQRLGPAEKVLLLAIYNGKPMADAQKIERVRELIRSVDGDKACLQLIADYEAKADAIIAQLQGLGYDTELMSNLTDELMNRVS